MRKLVALGLGVTTLAAVLSASAFAGPSRAIVQELGTVVPAGEVNIDLNVIPAATPVAGVTIGGGNATVGGATISSVNIGLGNGFEVRTGNLPGLSGITQGLAAPMGPTAPMGLTVKYSGLFPGLSLYAGYGSTNVTAIGTTTAATTSDTRIGAAFTMPIGPFIGNANIGFGSNTSQAAGAATATTNNVTDYGVALLYPLTANILVGGEYLGTNVTDYTVKGTTLGVSGLALGGRISAGHFTVDAVVMASENVSLTGVASNGTATGFGAPMLVRVNYAF